MKKDRDAGCRPHPDIPPGSSLLYMTASDVAMPFWESEVPKMPAMSVVENATPGVDIDWPNTLLPIWFVERAVPGVATDSPKTLGPIWVTESAVPKPANELPNTLPMLVSENAWPVCEIAFPKTLLPIWLVDWAVPISSIMLNSSSATVDYQMRALAGSENYVRFQVQLDEDSTGMDDASEKNMRKLEALAQEEVLRQSATIDWLCRALSRQDRKVLPFKPNTRVPIL
jgi:hypothetical protein